MASKRNSVHRTRWWLALVIWIKDHDKWGFTNPPKVKACVNYFEKQGTKYTWWMNTAHLANAIIVPVPGADVNRFVKLSIQDFWDAKIDLSSRVMGLSSVKLVEGYGIVMSTVLWISCESWNIVHKNYYDHCIYDDVINNNNNYSVILLTTNRYIGWYIGVTLFF